MEQQLVLEYGILGIIIIALVYVIKVLYRNQQKRTEALETDLKDLRNRFDLYMSEDRKEMLTVIVDNTEALKEIKLRN